MLCEKQALFGLFSFRIDPEKDLFNRLFDGAVLGFVAEICRGDWRGSGSGFIAPQFEGNLPERLGGLFLCDRLSP